MALSVALISQHLKILSGFSCCFLETASAPHSAFLDPESSQVASGSSGPFEESPDGNLPRMKLLASYIAPISGAVSPQSCLPLKEEKDRTGSILKAGLHLGQYCGL